MKNFCSIFTFLLAVFPAMSGDAANHSAKTEEIRIGFGTGANIIPFGGSSDGQPYQQIFSRTEFERYVVKKKIEVRELAFTSNPGIGSGITTMNVILRLATARTISPDFALNMGPDQRVVWNGTITANLTGRQPDDLQFDLRGKPFAYDPQKGDLLLQVEVVSSSGFSSSFSFGPSPVMWRIFHPLDGSFPRIEAAGLNTTLTVKIK